MTDLDFSATITERIQLVLDNRGVLTEELARQWIAATGIEPTERALVERQDSRTGTVVWWFDRKPETPRIEPQLDCAAIDASIESALRSLAHWPDWAIRGMGGEIAKQALEYKHKTGRYAS